MPATLPGYGFEEAFGLKRESTYGTAVSPDVWFKAISNSFIPKDPALAMPGPSGYWVDTLYSATRPRYYRSHKDVSGRTVLEAEYDDIGHIFQGLLPFVSSSPVSSHFLHVWSLGTSVAATNETSFTTQRHTGTNLETSTFPDLRITGSMIDAVEIAVADGQIVSVSVDWVGQDHTTVAASSVTLSTAPFIEYDDTSFRFNATRGTTLSGTDDQDSENAPIDLVWRCARNRRVIGATGLVATGAGSGRLIREPVPTGTTECTLEVNRDFFNNRFRALMYPATDPAAFCSVALFFESATIAGDTTRFSLSIDMKNAIVMGNHAEYGGGADIVPENIVFKAGTDGSDAPVQVVLVNGTTNYL